MAVRMMLGPKTVKSTSLEGASLAESVLTPDRSLHLVASRTLIGDWLQTAVTLSCFRQLHCCTARSTMTAAPHANVACLAVLQWWWRCKR